MNTALLFSGQGSQYVGMVKDLYESSNLAKDIIDSADAILGYSLSEICFNGPIETLKETRYTQPAIFLHSTVLFELLKDKLDFQAVSGHSVGEYAALYAAGVLRFKDALKLVSYRANLMFNAGEEMPGTMFAIINLDDAKVIEICERITKNANGEVAVAANFNSPGQVVISGSQNLLRENVNEFKQAGSRVIAKELIVSGAFHSPLMQSAKNELEQAIHSINFNDAKVPVYSNVSAKPLTDANQIKNALIMQLTSPVLWTQSLLNMKEDGFSKFIELGPGSVLQGLVKRTLTEVENLGFDKFIELSRD
ncbi:MAG: ACP S-malonyltransferase [Candidatus Kapabacteria bacterium]|nr:ACP S-malonyltransferase [Candidatus Kapabacteria bacterium]